MARPSRNDIVAAAKLFAHEWADAASERSESQTFWTEFLAVFGVQRRRAKAAFERHAQRSSTGGGGFIDLLWPGMLLVEQKSRGEDLDAAERQANDYIDSLTDAELPRLVVVSDFNRIRVRDYDASEPEAHEFELQDLPSNIDRFLTLAGYVQRTFKEEDAVNVQAAERVGLLYDELAATRYSMHQLRIFLVRVLFLMFGDDSGLWARNQFVDLVNNRTNEDGSDVGLWLSHLFAVMDTHEDLRTTTLDDDLKAFPYVNGGLFSERIEPPDMNRAMRNRLVEACNFNWSEISPAIFGAMFQSVMDPARRRSLGAHYTSEANILKTIGPLFTDSLWDELEACGASKRRLSNFHNRIAQLNFFDPACGCGNFLVIAYRELRRLEAEILTRQYPNGIQMTTDLSTYRKVSISQFYGLELEEFPARIAETAMYLMDHLENESLGVRFGINVVDLPLTDSASIKVGNALREEWNDFLPADQCSYVFGNPPFAGQYLRTPEQSEDLRYVWGSNYNGYLDFVTGWYAKVAAYDRAKKIKTAFVSTNSVSQGLPVYYLWKPLLDRGYEIDFAHRSFVWSSEGRGKARVHCVIVGMSAKSQGKKKRLFDYPDAKRDPIEVPAKHISPYLFDGNDTIARSRRSPNRDWLPRMSWGSKPVDQGGLIVEPESYDEVFNDIHARKYLREYRGSTELLNDEPRWCLWLESLDPADLRRSPILRARLDKVAEFRGASKKSATRELAASSHLFAERRQPTKSYLAVPQTSSEFRRVIPMKFLPPETIASNALYTIPDADLLTFGFLQSTLFTAWVRAVSGRLRNDFQIAPATVYYNFPYPEVSQKGADRIRTAAEGVLAARSEQHGWSLAALYAPRATPSEIMKAHNSLDRAVEASFGRRNALKSDVERLPLLFESYERIAEVGD